MKTALAPCAPIFAVAAWVAATLPASAQAQGGAIVLASHRAVYDLQLAAKRGKRAMQSARGRILYDFSGSACDGYSLQFRQVSELNSEEGKPTISDLRATSWEDGAAKRLRFHSENYFNDQLREAVDGQAERLDNGIRVRLTKPAEKTVSIDADVVFPTEHVRRIIAAARAGKTLLQLVVYDGSENGEKIYDTLTVIGQAIAPGERPPSDAIGGREPFSQMTRWPATISYFDRTEARHTGEQTPIYSISFELYENGVSRALMLDYGDFVLRGDVTSIEMREVGPCP
jgi:hypothetical protein